MKEDLYFGPDKKYATPHVPDFNNPAIEVKRIADVLNLSLTLSNSTDEDLWANIQFYVLPARPNSEVLKREGKWDEVLNNLALVATTAHPARQWLNHPVPDQHVWTSGTFAYTLPPWAHGFLLVATVTDFCKKESGITIAPSINPRWAIWVDPHAKK